MDKYLELYNRMQADIEYTAKELEVYPATMTAMVNRGLVRKIDSTPKRYVKIAASKLAQINTIISSNPPELEYFTLHRAGEKLAMCARVKNGRVYDCWDELYDVDNADWMQIGQTIYTLS